MHKVDFYTFDVILRYLAEDFLFDTSFNNLKIFFVRYYWFIKFLSIYNVYNNRFIFYFFCKLYSLFTKQVIDTFFLVSVDCLAVPNFKIISSLDIILNRTFSIKPIFFFHIKFDIFRFRFFTLRVDGLTYMFLRYYLEWFRVFKYNEYVENNLELLNVPKLRLYLRRPDPEYHYTYQALIKYKRKFKNHLYLLIRFFFTDYLELSEYANVNTSDDFLWACYLYLPYMRIFLLLYIFPDLMDWCNIYFLGYLKMFGIIFFYSTYVKSDPFFQNDDIYFFSETYVWRFELFLIFDDYFILFGPLYLHVKSLTAINSSNSLHFYSYILGSQESKPFDAIVRGFFYEILYLAITSYVSRFFFKRALEIEHMDLIDTIKFVSSLLDTHQWVYIQMDTNLRCFYLDFKFNLDNLMWLIFNSAYLYTFNLPFLINLNQGLKQLYYQIYAYDNFVNFFFLVDHFIVNLEEYYSDFVYKYFCFIVLRDFYFKLFERMCFLHFIFCCDLRSFFLFHLKITNIRYFKYLNDNLFLVAAFTFQPIDTTFI